VEDKHTPQTRCYGPCMTVRFKEMFHEKEWRNKEDPHCKECITRLKEQGKTHRCTRCRQWSARRDFAKTETSLVRHVCSECKKAGRRCIQCGKEKPETEFSATKWDQVLQRRVCMACSGDKACSSCRLRGDAKKFAKDEWAKPDGRRKCKDCVPKRCCKCLKLKVKSAYSKTQWALDEGKAVCVDCDRRRCGKCNKAKTWKDFEPNMWELADGSAEYCCRECTRGRRTPGMWTCANKRCKLQKLHSEFRLAIEKHGKGVRADNRQCDDCIRRREAEAAQQSAQSTQKVQKKPRTQ
jgi:hypothetical protein